MAKKASEIAEDPKRILGRLELPEEDAVLFLSALHEYGHPTSTAFMRQCAYALIEHASEKLPLILPLRFERISQYSVFDKQ